MTQKEIDKFLTCTKVYVNGKSKEIQEKLFSLGYSWNDECTDVCHTEAPFLFIYEDTSITMSTNMDVFCNHENREITAEEILSLELAEPNYRPFKTKEECWNEMLKHQPFGWFRSTCNKNLFNIICIDDEGIKITNTLTKSKKTYDRSFISLEFADGTPFGIKKD